MGLEQMLIIEGKPFIWLPLVYFISDRPSEARWISRRKQQHRKNSLRRKPGRGQTGPLGRVQATGVLVMLPIYFLQIAVYGCNTFLTSALKCGAITQRGPTDGSCLMW
jgi:hypothetical protein